MGDKRGRHRTDDARHVLTNIKFNCGIMVHGNNTRHIHGGGMVPYLYFPSTPQDGKEICSKGRGGGETNKAREKGDAWLDPSFGFGCKPALPRRFRINYMIDLDLTRAGNKLRRSRSCATCPQICFANELERDCLDRHLSYRALT